MFSQSSHASIHQITKFLPSYSGLQFKLELNALTKITTQKLKDLLLVLLVDLKYQQK